MLSTPGSLSSTVQHGADGALQMTGAATMTLGLSPEALAQWQADLQSRLARLEQHPEQGLGFIEEQVRQSTLELQRQIVERAMQAKADAIDETCDCCHTPLIQKKQRVRKTVHSYCGLLQLFRTHGWCKSCEQWVFPADAALGLLDNSTASPLVQEMSALLVSKMPCEQAEPVCARLTGLTISRSTLAREAQRQGDRAIPKREDQSKPSMASLAPHPPLGLDQPPKPFTLVLQIDAWNIRERDDWGKTQTKRERGEEIKRWHWVYTATCFRLEQRVRQGKERAVITERSYVATRRGVQPMIRQLHAEAMRRGLAQAERVLVIADGAVWIWNAAQDRFSEAIQRLDLFHANAYLWAVANDLHGAGTPAARRWVKPLLRQVRTDQVAKVISTLEELKAGLNESAATQTQKTIDYYRNNQARMQYLEGEKRGEPVGSGAIESTCRQLQCRMKRCGQFWSSEGDEALLCLELFWRNDRWHFLFPHAQITSLSRN
jgi:predicted membrane protein